ncbi:VOC family protein [Novosphingobium sp. B 225]|uniref:VOC family protein n=1 Tax=Novosphingobium sp. B 225 TaxID=1961849 RepID=UPI000B4A624A|nr:VOC family protein [Novosphingobium sp. B 225]
MSKPAGTPDGIHHIAFMAGDMKRQLEFFTAVMGFPLVAIFEMHGVPGAMHAFLKMADDSLFSLVHVPGGEAIPTTMGVTHAGRGEAPAAPGALQHTAFRVPDMAALYAMRDRVRSHGIPVLGPIDHGFCKSVYFAGPEHMTLEVSTFTTPVEPQVWIDRAMLAGLGLSEAEMEAMIAPPGLDGPGGLSQPAYDPAVPHLDYPQAQYERMLATPDSVFESLPAYPPPNPA